MVWKGIGKRGTLYTLKSLHVLFYHKDLLQTTSEGHTKIADSLHSQIIPEWRYLSVTPTATILLRCIVV